MVNKEIQGYSTPKYIVEDSDAGLELRPVTLLLIGFVFFTQVC